MIDDDDERYTEWEEAEQIGVSRVARALEPYLVALRKAQIAVDHAQAKLDLFVLRLAAGDELWSDEDEEAI